MKTRTFQVSKTITISAVLVSILLLLSCSKKNPTDSGTGGGGNNLQAITTLPSSGPPMTVVTIQGLDLANTDLTDSYAFVNGSLAPLFVTDSTVKVTIPVIVDTTTMWIDTSVTSMSLVIVKSQSGDTVAIGRDVFTLEVLLPAPGSVTQMMTDWGTITSSLQTITQSLAGAPGVQQQVSTSLLSALDSLVNGSDSLSLKSLTAKLTAGSPQELALLDALFASSGVVEQSQKYAVMFQAMADSAAIFGAPALRRSAVTPTVLTDQQLTFAMQFYVVIREFGRTVIAPTAQTYAIVTGAIGLIGNIPIASVISATLSVIDFIVNKFVVSVLPASIDSLRITVARDTIFVGESTTATVSIYTKNDPQAITFQDLIAQILNGLGYVSSISSRFAVNELDDLADVLKNVTNYMLGLFQTGLGAYAGAHPALNLDIAVTNMPQMRFEAQITHTKFVDIKTHTPNLIQPMPGEVNWKADASTTGEGRIYAVTPASGATVIPQPVGFEYNAGAFGENVASAPAVSVWSLKKMGLLVDFAPIITAGGANVLGVTAGHLDPFGTLVPEAGIKIDLLATGGVANPVTGFTDATGQFASVITLNPFTDTVTVLVTATNTTASTTAKDTVMAATQSGLSRVAHISLRDGALGIWSVNPNDTSDIIKLCTVNSNRTFFPVRGMFWSRDSKWLVYNLSTSSGLGVYTTGGTALNFQRTIFDPRFFGSTSAHSQSWFSGNPSEFLIGANQRNVTRPLRGQFICNASGSRTVIAGTDLLNDQISMFISPDDQTVAYSKTCGNNTNCFYTLSVNNIANGTPRQIAGSFDQTANIFASILGWTEDGTSLLYRKTKGIVAAGRTTEIRIMNADGSNNRLIATIPGGFGGFTFLPTKNALAFLGAVNPGNNNIVWTLYTADFAGTLQEITGVQSSFFSLTASPDGQYLAYDGNNANTRIYKLDLTTLQETIMVDDSMAFMPAWSGFMAP